MCLRLFSASVCGELLISSVDARKQFRLNLGFTTTRHRSLWKRSVWGEHLANRSGAQRKKVRRTRLNDKRKALKPGIDCARLPRETMFVALPRKVYTMLPRSAERTLPRANLVGVEPNRSGSLSRGKGISVCCALSVETVLCMRNSVEQRPHAAAARNRYPASDDGSVLWTGQPNAIQFTVISVPWGTLNALCTV
jgi:hypothetical protein